MLRLVVFVLIVVVAFVIALPLFQSEEVTYDSVIRNSVETMEEAAQLLEGVQTTEDAKQIAPRLDALVERFDALTRQAEELPEPSSEEKVRVTKAHQDRLTAVGARWAKATASLATKPGAMVVLAGSLESLGRLMRR